MSEESHRRRVASDAPSAFHHLRRALLDGIGKLAASIVPVDLAAKPVAGGQVRHECRTDVETIRRLQNRGTLHGRNRLLRVEAQLGVQRERTVMKSGLEQANTRE